MRLASDAAEPGSASSDSRRARIGSSATTAAAGSSMTSRSASGSIAAMESLTSFVVNRTRAGPRPSGSHSIEPHKVTSPPFGDTYRGTRDGPVGGCGVTSFGELYARYAQDVYRFALYLSGDRHEAEDITSETFVRAWTATVPIRTETVKGYLLTI